MDNLEMQMEWEYFRDKLFDISNLHIQTGNEKEVAFKMGCLHSIADENARKIEDAFIENYQRTEK